MYTATKCLLLGIVVVMVLLSGRGLFQSLKSAQANIQQKVVDLIEGKEK